MNAISFQITRNFNKLINKNHCKTQFGSFYVYHKVIPQRVLLIEAISFNIEQWGT